MTRLEAIKLCGIAACATVIGCSRKTMFELFGPTKGAYLSVDSNACTGCRKCIAVCNADAITIISNKAVIDPTTCNQCWKCIDACPYDAIY